MNNYSAMLPYINGSEYENHFWNALRGKKGHNGYLEKGVDSYSRAFALTASGQNKFATAVKNEGLFRNLATAICAYDCEYRIKTANSDDVAVWVPEGGSIPITDGMEDFGDLTLESHKLAVFFKLEESFVRDATFKIEDYIVSRLAKNFGRAEDNGVINGTGENMPTGILAAKGGADVGVTIDTITYEDLVKLFFSVKPEYHRNGVWLMNDETALALRTLKDDGGNYIWNHANDTISGQEGVHFRVYAFRQSWRKAYRLW